MVQFFKRIEFVHADLRTDLIYYDDVKRRIRIIDFGISHFLEDKDKDSFQVQTRHFRAPEIMFGLNYDTSMDIWSIGCILAELSIGEVIFRGEDETDQIFCIMEYLGLPPDYMIKQQMKYSLFDENNQPKDYCNSKGKVRKHKSKKYR